mmetsp:Transcript_20633/g.69023  ORF Transcript_20633/g.69023 Transcript_20633/m.69023 type:complete len:230 (+) Transcript_20633:1993-2682(+)
MVKLRHTLNSLKASLRFSLGSNKLTPGSFTGNRSSSNTKTKLSPPPTSPSSIGSTRFDISSSSPALYDTPPPIHRIPFLWRNPGVLRSILGMTMLWRRRRIGAPGEKTLPIHRRSSTVDTAITSAAANPTSWAPAACSMCRSEASSSSVPLGRTSWSETTTSLASCVLGLSRRKGIHCWGMLRADGKRKKRLSISTTSTLSSSSRRAGMSVLLMPQIDLAPPPRWLLEM